MPKKFRIKNLFILGLILICMKNIKNIYYSLFPSTVPENIQIMTLRTSTELQNMILNIYFFCNSDSLKLFVQFSGKYLDR